MDVAAAAARGVVAAAAAARGVDTADLDPAVESLDAVASFGHPVDDDALDAAPAVLGAAAAAAMAALLADVAPLLETPVDGFEVVVVVVDALLAHCLAPVHLGASPAAAAAALLVLTALGVGSGLLLPADASSHARPHAC